MDPWRSRLISEFKALNRDTQREIDEISGKLKDLWSQSECCHCRLKCFEGDTIVLACEHAHCLDCVADRLERQRGFFERCSQSIMSDFPILSDVIVCSQCHSASAVKSKVEFQGRLAQKERAFQGKLRFQLDRERTETIISKIKVCEYYQNQRRTLIGKFSYESLYFFERPRFSDSTGKLVDVESINRFYQSRDVEGHNMWLEEWCRDTSSGDPQGWYYCFNWPTNDSDWVFAPSATTFVRRRRMLRTCIRLPETLKTDVSK